MSQPTSSHGAASSASHGHDAHDVSKSVRKYLLVFAALLIGTIVTVLASFIHFPTVKINIAVALFIATIKGALVAGYFMHLLDERKMIYSILGTTVFFFAGLMYLTLWSMESQHLIHYHNVP